MHFCIRLKAATNERTEASVHRIEIKLKKPESSLNRFRVKATDAFHNLQNHRKLVVSMPRLSAPSCHSRLFFIYFRLFNTVDSKQMFIKSLRMTGFEPWISGVRGDRSTTEPLTAQPNRLIQDPLIQDPMSLEYYLRNNSFITGKWLWLSW